MIAAILTKIRLFRLKRAIRVCEKAGLAAVNIKRSDGAIYIISGSGTYVRFDKVKS